MDIDADLETVAASATNVLTYKAQNI